MTQMMHAMSVGTFAPALRSLSMLLDKTASHPQSGEFLGRSLAPDMYPLAMQIELTCLHALTGVARLTGDAPQPMAPPPETLAAAQTRIAGAADTVAAVAEARFEDSETLAIRMELGSGLRLEANGLQFLRDWALPHFYFHYVTAYDILRHSGVELGKSDYLAHVGYAIRPV